MSVITKEDVDVTEIPEVTANSAIGTGKEAVSAVEFVMNSEGFSDLQANWDWNGANTREIDQMGDSLKSAFAELAKGQGANQGGDISFVTNGTTIDVMNGDTVVDSIEFDLNEKSTLKQAITTTDAKGNEVSGFDRGRIQDKTIEKHINRPPINKE
jgi:hypothetical protein